MSDLLVKLAAIEEQAASLGEQLADSATANAPAEYARIAKELSGLRATVEAAERYRKIVSDLEDAQAMLEDSDPDLRELASAELEEKQPERETLEEEIRQLLIPKDPNDEKSVILEIRAGTGGDEAALFAGELFRMYTRYAERSGWKIEPLSLSESGVGGVKEVVVSVGGSGAYGRLKYERGVHRVQRVPATESQGRIHTSTVTVAVLPEAEEVDVRLDPKDLRIDVYRSSGPGGQSVNTTDSAVRITYIPTGTVVQCQDEKSQHKNKAKALKVLRSRVLEAEQAREQGERAKERREQVGTGERSEKIRTYNYPQSRITDHRAGLTLHRLTEVIDGDLDEMLEAIKQELASRELAGGSAA